MISHMIMVMNVFHANYPNSGIKTKMPVINVKITISITLQMNNVKYAQQALQLKEMETAIHALKELIITKILKCVLNVELEAILIIRKIIVFSSHM